MPNSVLKNPPRYGRGPLSRGLKAGDESPIVRDGGDEGAGLIRGFAVITRGEALGHREWIDAEALKQVADAINATGDVGVKSRFTHPGLSADGLGKFLGRAKSARVDGDVVRADLHLAKSAHSTPDGDLADYVMTLAETDPAAFGASIVFAHDSEAEDAFEQEHGGDEFQSPDPDNVNNFPHIRLKELRAVDAVDEPAANPSGWFHRGQEIAEEAESLLSYALGMTSDPPEVSQFEIDPDRVRAFVGKFLDRHGLSIGPKLKGGEMPGSQPKAESREEFTAELRRFVEKFGEDGAKWFAEGKSYIEALELFAAKRGEQLAAKDEEIASLNRRIQSIDRGEREPVEFQDASQTADQKRVAQYTKALGENVGRFAAAIKLPTK